MGKTYLENAIQEEARALVEDLKSLNGEATTYPKSLRTAVLNVVWQLVAGRRYDLRSKEVDKIYDIGQRGRKASIMVFIPALFPALDALPKFVKFRLFQTHIIDEFRNEMRDIVKVRGIILSIS